MSPVTRQFAVHPRRWIVEPVSVGRMCADIERSDPSTAWKLRVSARRGGQGSRPPEAAGLRPVLDLPFGLKNPHPCARRTGLDGSVDPPLPACGERPTRVSERVRGRSVLRERPSPSPSPLRACSGRGCARRFFNPHPRSGGGGPCGAWWRGRARAQRSGSSRARFLAPLDRQAERAHPVLPPPPPRIKSGAHGPLPVASDGGGVRRHSAPRRGGGIAYRTVLC
jgi:hypothetical protein